MTALLALFWVLVGAFLALLGVFIVLVVQWHRADRHLQEALARPWPRTPPPSAPPTERSPEHP